MLSLLSLISSGAGCASRPYRPGSAQHYHLSSQLAAITEPQFERGKPRPVMDKVGWVFGIPSRIVLWNWGIDRHSISPDTEARLAEYLAVNELDTVKVRINQYDPLGEWDRLVANKAVGWGWRYTGGTLTWLGYTLLPGRIWGGDNFNPYTNTINLYSDVPAVAIHEGGHAKDFAQRRWKGTYAAIYGLPIVPLWHEARATRDALGYLQEYGDAEAEREGYRVLYPAYATYIGGNAANFLPWNSLLVYGAAVVPAHVIGRLRSLAPRDHDSGLLPVYPESAPAAPTDTEFLSPDLAVISASGDLAPRAAAEAALPDKYFIRSPSDSPAPGAR